MLFLSVIRLEQMSFSYFVTVFVYLYESGEEIPEQLGKIIHKPHRIF